MLSKSASFLKENLNKNPSYPASKTKKLQEDIIATLGLGEGKELILLLTVIASYFVNSEKLGKTDRNLMFVKILEDLALNNKTEHTNYISKHNYIYQKVLLKMDELFDKKGTLKNNASIWEILKFIDQHQLAGEFRKGDIVHGEAARIGKRVRYLDEQIKMYKSNFVFPPVEYISKIIGKLDEKLKDNNLSVYEKAAKIGTYIFMAHPFEDGNSRSSRISMISYLHNLGKIDIAFYTFVSNFSKTLSDQSYYKFLQDNVYSRYLNFRDKLEFDEKGNIEKYISLEEYLAIVEEVSKQLEKRLIKIHKIILQNRENIYLFTSLLAKYLNLLKQKEKNENEIKLFRAFVIALFKGVNENGIENIKDFVASFKFSKKFQKKNYDITNKDYEKFYKKLRQIII